MNADLRQTLASFLEKVKNNSEKKTPWIDPIAFEDEIKNQFEVLKNSIHKEHTDRIYQEIFDWGPLSSLFEDESISEILINTPESIWIEKNGNLQRHHDTFLSEFTFDRFIQKISGLTNKFLSLENPFFDGQIGLFRVHVASHDPKPLVTLRKQSNAIWSFERLLKERWASEGEISVLKSWVDQRKNILVIGGTGSGKTSVLNSLLNEIDSNQRVILIEDTQELKVPNEASVRLLTRSQSGSGLQPVDQSELVRQSLRMRPDRVVVGEVRGGEAKDLLMALSTGHAGSMGTLHAFHAQQALFRFEAMVQIGAPMWPSSVVRKMVSMGLDCIVTVGKNSTGTRKLVGLHEVASLEESGILLEPRFELQQ